MILTCDAIKHKMGCCSGCCRKATGNTLLRRIIKENKVVIFSRSDCPYSSQIKTLFSQLGVGFAVIELDHCRNAKKLVKALTDMTNHFTVPQVFIDGKFVGGEIEIWHMKSTGDLRKKLEEVFPGLKCRWPQLDEIKPCSPTVVGPRMALPRSWSIPTHFNKYKPIYPGSPPYAKPLPAGTKPWPDSLMFGQRYI